MNPKSPKTFKEFLRSNFAGMISFRPLFAFVGLSLGGIYKSSWEEYLQFISMWQFWAIFAAALVIDAILGAWMWSDWHKRKAKKEARQSEKSKTDES
jgi:membrane protein DedA with SNARE-associated domain